MPNFKDGNSLRDKAKDAIAECFINKHKAPTIADVMRDDGDFVCQIADAIFDVMGIDSKDQDLNELMINLHVTGGVAHVNRKTSGFSVSLIDYDDEGDPQEIKQEWAVEDREGFEDADTQETD